MVRSSNLANWFDRQLTIIFGDDLNLYHNFTLRWVILWTYFPSFQIYKCVTHMNFVWVTEVTSMSGNLLLFSTKWFEELRLIFWSIIILTTAFWYLTTFSINSVTPGCSLVKKILFFEVFLSSHMPHEVIGLNRSLWLDFETFFALESLRSWFF